MVFALYPIYVFCGVLSRYIRLSYLTQQKFQSSRRYLPLVDHPCETVSVMILAMTIQRRWYAVVVMLSYIVLLQVPNTNCL